MDIKKLCQVGEGKTLEYKRNTDSLESVLKSVIAFANTVGGIILIGVEDVQNRHQLVYNKFTSVYQSYIIFE